MEIRALISRLEGHIEDDSIVVSATIKTAVRTGGVDLPESTTVLRTKYPRDLIRQILTRTSSQMTVQSAGIGTSELRG